MFQTYVPNQKIVEGKQTHIIFLKAFLNLMIRNIET